MESTMLNLLIRSLFKATLQLRVDIGEGSLRIVLATRFCQAHFSYCSLSGPRIQFHIFPSIGSTEGGTSSSLPLIQGILSTSRAV